VTQVQILAGLVFFYSDKFYKKNTLSFFIMRKTGQKKKNQEVQPNNLISRRSILATGLSFAALAGAAYFGLNRDDNWNFLKDAHSDEVHDSSEIALKYPALSEERQIYASDPITKPIIERVWPLIEKDIKLGNVSRTGWTANIFTREHASPIAEKEASQFQSYALNSIDFLHSKINGLEKLNLDWSYVAPGEDYSKSSSNVFIGSEYHEVVRAYLKSNATGQVLQSYTHMRSAPSAITKVRSREGKPYVDWIFLCKGPSAITSPMAEYVHANTQREYLSHMQKASIEMVHQTNEAIAEGIAQFIGHELVDELQVPDGELKLSKSLNYSDPDYALVKNSTTWIRNNGVQSAFDLYKESPEKFMQAISQK
jgi:hypothetical protein